MNKKALIVLEIIWITLAIVSLVLGIYNTVVETLRTSYVFFIISALSFMMYTFRHRMRKSQND